jgi:hypothetical protein
MKLGFLTACLPKQDLGQIATYAAQAGDQTLEVAAWPDLGHLPSAATHLDVVGRTNAKADEVNEFLDRRSRSLSSLPIGGNR